MCSLPAALLAVTAQTVRAVDETTTGTRDFAVAEEQQVSENRIVKQQMHYAAYLHFIATLTHTNASQQAVAQR